MHVMKDQFNKALGAAIRDERMARGLSQRELGERVDVTYQQVQRYESGLNSCSAHTVMCFAEALHLSVAELYQRAGAPIAATEAASEENDAYLISKYVRQIKDAALRLNLVQFAKNSVYRPRRKA